VGVLIFGRKGGGPPLNFDPVRPMTVMRPKESITQRIGCAFWMCVLAQQLNEFSLLECVSPSVA
jgi:hypothetical protein